MSTTFETDRVKLRLLYWNCRGRVQAVRYVLADIASKHRNVDYKEELELLDTMKTTWPQRKADQTISGPFQTLPVLHWNDTHSFGQTLTIAHVLAKKFNLYGKTTSSNTDPVLLEGYINGVVTCAYSDVIENALKTVWSQTDVKNQNTLDYFLLRRAQDTLASLEKILRQSSTEFFYDQINPSIADYFAFEAYTLVHYIHPKLVPNDCQALFKLQQRMKEQSGIANYLNSGQLAKRLTAAPHEDEYLVKLAEIL